MAGYSPRPLAAKLGLKEGQQRSLVNMPDAVAELLGADAQEGRVTVLQASAGRRDDVIMLFVTRQEELVNAIEPLSARLKTDGMVWLCWPKKASRVPTDITEDVLRAILLPIGLVDVKVCAVDAIWSGLKFVWRKTIRSGLAD